MAENQNTPLGGNTNNNGISADALIAAIDHLASSSSETIKVLKSIADQVKGSKGSSNFNGEQLTRSIKKYIKEENDSRVKQIREINNITKSLQDNKNYLKRYNKEIEEECLKLSKNGLSEETKELNAYLKDVNKSMDKYISISATTLNRYRDSISKNARKLSDIEYDIAKLNTDYSKATASNEKAIKDALAAKNKEKEQLEKQLEITKANFEKEQRFTEYRGKLEKQNADELKDLLHRRAEIESRSTNLLSSNQKNLKESLSKFSDFFNPKSSDSYISQKSEVESYDKEAETRIKVIEDEYKANEDLIKDEENVITEAEAVISELTNLIINADKDEKRRYQELKKTKRNELEQSKRNVEDIKRRNENLKQQKVVLKGNQEANKKFLANLDKQTTVWNNIGNKLGETISKVITTVIDRELTRLVNAANKAFDTMESTQKSLGKTLKMSTGAYQDYVDLVQSYAKEAGLAIDQNQVLELSATLSEMGLRDENLIVALATEQAKIQEAGLNGVLQLNEETIKQYQAEYFRNIKEGISEDKATELLMGHIDALIASEKVAVDEFGSATALANGGMTEILNRVTTLKSMGYFGEGEEAAKAEDEFVANLIYMAQAFDSAGADFSTVLSDIDSLMGSTPSEVSDQLKMVMTQMGTNEKIISDLVQNPNAVISKYLEVTNAQYEGKGLTGIQYTGSALGDSFTAQQRMNLLNANINTESLKDQTVTLDKLNNSISTTNEDLKSGEYLTETEKIEKKELETMQEIAQYAQKIPDGQFWMDNTLNAGKSLLNDLGGLLGNFLGSALGSKIGSTGAGGGFLGRNADRSKLSTGSAGDFLMGNKSTKAGMLGSEITGTAGIVYGQVILGKNFFEGYADDGLSGGLEGLAEGFGDKEFSRGMGMALGGAIGGPVGAVIGSELGANLVPKAQEKFEEWLTDCWDPFMSIDDSAEEAYKQLIQAGKDIQNAADELSTASTTSLKNLQTEKTESEGWTAYQQKQWLAQHSAELEALNINKENLNTEADVNDAFQKAFTSYFEREEKRLTIDQNIGNFGSKYSKALGSLSANETERTKSGGSSVIKTMTNAGITLDNFNNLISDYMTANALEDNEENRKQATSAILSKLNITDESKQAEIRGEIEYWQTLKDDWTKANKEFQTKWQKAKEVAGVDDAVAIQAAYEQLYGKNGSEKPNPFLDLNAAIDSSFLGTNGEVPILDTSNGEYYKGGYMTQIAGKYYPLYKTGLDFVPYDNYLALLHQGETVLNSTEANEYRAGNSINISDITSTMITQTDRIESILTKIYTAIISMNRSNNGRSSLNSNIVNMVSGIATI